MKAPLSYCVDIKTSKLLDAYEKLLRSTTKNGAPLEAVVEFSEVALASLHIARFDRQQAWSRLFDIAPWLVASVVSGVVHAVFHCWRSQ